MTQRGFVKRGRGFYIGVEVIGDRLFVAVSVGGRWWQAARRIVERARR